MQLIEVKTKKQHNDFLNLPHFIYKEDPYWIPNIKQEISDVFNKNKNSYYKKGETIRFILENNGRVIGRVAAFYHPKLPVGGMGFFECINNKTAAFLLFNACKNWLIKKGYTAMDGPINFGERDKYWGLIIENFKLEPFYGINYNPEYYVSFFEEYGFKIYFKQLIFHRKAKDKLQDKYEEKALNILKNPEYTCKHIEKKNLAKYAEDFRSIYNSAWTERDGKEFKEMPKEQALKMVNKMKPIMEEKLIWFAYHNDKPVGFYISLPEINQYFKYVNGNFNWWGKLKFITMKLLKPTKISYAIAFGIDPAYQGLGIEGYIFKYCQENIGKVYTDVMVMWLGDFNPKILRIVEQMGTKKLRTMATYRKLFDEKEEFKRMPILE